MTTRIGREYEVMSAIDKLGLRLIKSDELVEYNDSTVTLFTLPAYSVVVGLFCQVNTAFDRDVDITVGDGTTAALYASVSGRTDSGALASALSSTASRLVQFWPMFEKTSASSIIATVTSRVPTGGTALAAGSSEWWLIFRPMTADRNP
jgi:hypothetical protein